MGIFALLAACNGGPAGGTDAASQGSDSASSTDSDGATTSQGGATAAGDPTGPTGSDSNSGGQTTGDSDTSGPDPTATGSTSSGETSTASTTGGVDTGSSSEGTTGDEPGDEPCPLAMMHLACDMASDDPLHALGVNCTSLGGEYVDNVTAVAAAKVVHEFPPPIDGERVWQVARAYGTHVDPNTQKPFWGAREGDKLLLISSGLLPPPDNSGVVIVPDGDVYNDSYPSLVFDDPPFDDNSMPPSMSPQKGSQDPNGFTNCDGKGDCSNTIYDQWQSGNGDAEDKTWLGFELTAPAIANGAIADANGYTFDFAYFSAEFPEFVDTEYNDIFVVWQSSEMYTGNVVFVDEQPLTVTALWPVDFQGECEPLDPNCQGYDPVLAGTGYIADGGATSWYTATGGVNPGETFTLTFGVFDMGDSIYDTTAIIDNWMWDCEGCVPNEVNSCGIAPQ